MNKITRSKKYQPGMKFNALTLIRPTEERKRKCVVWECQCDCGNIKNFSTDEFKHRKSCGCMAHDKTKNKIKPNDKFGKLTVIEEIPERDNGRNIHYKCICECGNIITPRSSDLKNGYSTSCGKCKIGTYKDLSNKKFGKLIAIEPILNKNDKCYEGRAGRNMIWLCKCECGTTKKIPANWLTERRVVSCGCGIGTISAGEQEIINILNNNKIKYRTEVTFSDLFSDKNRNLRFDFGLIDDNNNIIRLIEFDGKQHFEAASGYYTNKFNRIQKHDKIKNDYCKNNNIPLVRLPYWELNNITLDMLLGEKYLVV